MNVSMLQTIVFASLLIGSSVVAGQENEICRAKEQSSHMLGRQISFSGKVVSDGMHATLVLPNDCSNVGYPIAPEDSDNSPSTIIRQTLMRVGFPGTVDKEVRVDVDAVIVILGNGKVGIKVTKLRRLVMTYPSSG